MPNSGPRRDVPEEDCSVDLTHLGSLPELVYGVSVDHLPDDLKLARNIAVRMCRYDAILCMVGLLLTAAAGRGGLRFLNIGINGIILGCSALGLWASKGFRINWIGAHAALVFGFVSIFFLFVSLTIMFGSDLARNNW